MLYLKEIDSQEIRLMLISCSKLSMINTSVLLFQLLEPGKTRSRTTVPINLAAVTWLE